MPDFTAMTDDDLPRRADGLRLLPDETPDGVLADYAAAARRTDELVTTLPDLDVAQPLSKAPWFPAGAWWSARRVLMRLLAETAQHPGRADIVRESLDAAKGTGQARLTRSA